MGLGAYDEDEHERRDQLINQNGDEEYDEGLDRYEGEVEFEYGEAEDDEEAIDEMLSNL